MVAYQVGRRARERAPWWRGAPGARLRGRVRTRRRRPTRGRRPCRRGFTRRVLATAAANKDVVLALISGIAAPIAGALAARLTAKPAAAAPAQHVTVTVTIEGASAAAEPGISDAALLLKRQQTAITNARRLLALYDPWRPAEHDPSTTVHQLVEELNKHRRP